MYRKDVPRGSMKLSVQNMSAMTYLMKQKTYLTHDNCFVKYLTTLNKDQKLCVIK